MCSTVFCWWKILMLMVSIWNWFWLSGKQKRACAIQRQSHQPIQHKIPIWVLITIVKQTIFSASYAHALGNKWEQPTADQTDQVFRSTLDPLLPDFYGILVQWTPISYDKEQKLKHIGDVTQQRKHMEQTGTWHCYEEKQRTISKKSWQIKATTPCP